MDYGDPRTFEPDKGYGGQKYVAYFCCGGSLHPVKHVYEICMPIGVSLVVAGWMTLEKAQADYGTENVFVSPSSTLCQDCLFAMLKSHAANKKREFTESD